MKKNIIDKVKTFEDACQILGLNPDDINFKVPPNSGLESYANFINASGKLAIITRCLNEGWKPNWDDNKETKYYPWFEMKTVLGFGLDVVNAYDWYSTVSSRLCFKDKKLCEYATKQFKDIYEAYMLNSK